MPDDKNTGIILNAIGEVQKRVEKVDTNVDALQSITGELKGDVRTLGAKVEGIDKRVDSHNGNFDKLFSKVETALDTAKDARAMVWKRSTIVISVIGVLGGIVVAAIEVWG